MYANESKSKSAIKEIKENLHSLSSFLGSTESLSVESHSTSRTGEESEPCTSHLSEKNELPVSYNVLFESGYKIHKNTIIGM